MYTRTIIYRIYSIIMMAIGAIGFAFSLKSIMDLAKLEQFDYIPNFKALRIGWMIGIGGAALISLFFSYVEFSSMFNFSDMIKHEKSGSTAPFKRRGFVLPPKFYSVFGTVIFSIVAISYTILGIAMVISTSVKTGQFIVLPVLPIIAIVAICLLFFVNYFVRYRALGTLMELKETKEYSDAVKQKTNEIASGWLRGYCGFLVIMCALLAIGTAVLIYLTVTTIFDKEAFEEFGALFVAIGVVLSKFMGTWVLESQSNLATGIVIAEVVFAAISGVCMGVLGCYVDNIAKMLEHYQIKFGLFDKKKTEKQ